MGDLSFEELVVMIKADVGALTCVLWHLHNRIEELEQDIIDLSAKTNRQERKFRSKFTD